MSKLNMIFLGAPGAGKGTQSDIVAEKYGIPFVVSYTTRPMREGEVDGVDHNFVSEKDMPDFDKMIAFTIFGGNKYWATHSQIGEGVTSYVIDERGLLKMIDNYNKYRYVKVYVYRDNNDVDEDRKSRDENRIILHDNFYDLVIVNNYNSVDEFLEGASKQIIEYLENHKLYFHDNII